MLALSGIHHRYGRHRALDGVDLHLQPGTCYGFLGHNGAGKTSLIRVALGLAQPRRGHLQVDGIDARREPRRARSLLGGTVETHAFHNQRTALDNLQLLGGLQGMSRRQARRDGERVLEATGLGAVAHRRVGTFSLGMRQRLGIAQALLGDRPYLLLDEPFSNLDPEGIAELRALLHDLARNRNRALLLSSHQLHELEGLCSHVGILRAGRMLREDRLDALLQAGHGSAYRLQVREPRAVASGLAPLALAATAVADAPHAFDLDLGDVPAERVVQALVETGAGVVSFARRPVTLEQVYLALHRQPPAVPAAAAATDRDAAPGPVAAAIAAAPPAVPWPSALLRAARYEGRRMRRWRTLPLWLGPAAVAAWTVHRRATAAARDAALVDAGDLFSTTVASAWDAIPSAMAAAAGMLAVLLAAYGSQAIAGEEGRGTLSLAAMRPVGRLPLLLGKALTWALCGGAAAWLLALLVAYGLASATLPFTPPTERFAGGDTAPLLDAEVLRGGLWPALSSTLLPLGAYLALGVLVGVVARRGTSALATVLAAVVALEVVRGGSGTYEAWLPSAHLPSRLRDTSELRMFCDLALGRADAYAPFAGWRIAASLLWVGTCTALAAVVFRQRRLS